MTTTPEVPTIFIGKKPIGRYIYACKKAFETSKTIKIVARGVLISKAVAVAEIVRSKLLNSTYKAEIASIEATNKMGRNIFVSTMSITLIVP